MPLSTLRYEPDKEGADSIVGHKRSLGTSSPSTPGLCSQLCRVNCLSEDLRRPELIQSETTCLVETVKSRLWILYPQACIELWWMKGLSGVADGD